MASTSLPTMQTQVPVLRRVPDMTPAAAPVRRLPSDITPAAAAPVHRLPSAHASWRAGDTAKVIVIVLCLAYLSCVALHESGHLDIFARSYQAEGFCVSNRGASRWLQSHAISFYADAAAAAGMGLLVRAGSARQMSDEALAPIGKNALSLLGHGCGHLFLAASTTSESGASRAFEDLDAPGRTFAFVALLAVWYGFMRDRRRSLATTLGYALAHNALQVFVLPSRFFFTHVLMAVLLNSAARKLRMRPAEKSLYYDLEAWLVDVPILLASFGEALGCDTFLVRHGGHVWFDMVVPCGFAVYFAILVGTGHGLAARGRCERAAPLCAAVQKQRSFGSERCLCRPGEGYFAR